MRDHPVHASKVCEKWIIDFLGKPCLILGPLKIFGLAVFFKVEHLKVVINLRDAGFCCYCSKGRIAE